MPWVRFDDQFPIHRKVDGLSDAAYRLHTSAIFWSARNLTDGFVSREDLDGVTARVRTPARFAAECVKREVWHDARRDCPSEDCPGPVDKDGWVIHDYWDYQPSKAQVIHNRESDRQRQKRHRDGRNAVSHAVTDAVSPPAPSRPVPGDPVVDVVDRANGSSQARASPEVIDSIIREILDVTGRHITEEWAQRVADHVLEGRTPANPAAYIRQAIRNDPDPKRRFLPLY